MGYYRERVGTTRGTGRYGSGTLEQAFPNRESGGPSEFLLGDQTGTRLGDDHMDFGEFLQKMDKLNGLISGHTACDA
jgi:hypothetical protein